MFWRYSPNSSSCRGYDGISAGRSHPRSIQCQVISTSTHQPCELSSMTSNMFDQVISTSMFNSVISLSDLSQVISIKLSLNRLFDHDVQPSDLNRYHPAMHSQPSDRGQVISTKMSRPSELSQVIATRISLTSELSNVISTKTSEASDVSQVISP